MTPKRLRQVRRRVRIDAGRDVQQHPVALVRPRGAQIGLEKPERLRRTVLTLRAAGAVAQRIENVVRHDDAQSADGQPCDVAAVVREALREIRSRAAPVDERRPGRGRGGEKRAVDRRSVVAAGRIVVSERDHELRPRKGRVEALGQRHHRRGGRIEAEVVRQKIAGDDDDGRIGIDRARLG